MQIHSFLFDLLCIINSKGRIKGSKPFLYFGRGHLKLRIYISSILVGPQGIPPIKPKNAFSEFLVPKSLKQHFST
jgi:hypothetical protein